MTSKTSRAPRWLLMVIILYMAVLAALTLLNRMGPERWWVSAMNLYLPQIFWLVPGMVITPVCLVKARRWLLAPLICMAWVAGPIMGFCWPSQGLRQVPEKARFRIMTWNVKYGLHGASGQSSLREEIERTRPDIVLFQDAGRILEGPMGQFFRQWATHSEGQFMVASRFALSGFEVRPISLPWEKSSCLRCQTRIGSATITLYNVHLETPRKGLNAIKSARNRPWYLPNAVQQMEANILTRLMQAHILNNFILRESGQHIIVTGDLNSPDASQVCAGLRDIGLHDAFTEGGRGYGYTYGHFLLLHRIPWLRLSWMRIDHIMVCSQLMAVRAWAGTGEASDHRPVIADIVVRQP